MLRVKPLPGQLFRLAIPAAVVAVLLAVAGRAEPQFAVEHRLPLDERYTAQIREHTTEPFFLTEMVDHLPASESVPTPEAVLGYIIGTPDVLTYTADQYRYYRELARTSPRVQVFTKPEPTEEGKESLLVVIGDEAAIQRLDHYKGITNRLADPRELTDEQARQLAGEGKAFYWLTAGLHSPETGPPEMLMELAYRLAVCESDHIRNIRENVIVMLTPTLEPDGRDRRVDLHNYSRANRGPTPSLLYWGHYVAHDNNRDCLGMGLALTRNAMRTFLDYRPQVMHDLHESVPFLYVSTGTGPYNAWLDPMLVDEWHQLSYHEVGEMTRRGVPGVWTHGFYDGWAPNYLFFVANAHNSIGRFYETFGNGGPATRTRTVGAQSQRAWFRPNPPLPRVQWSMRNNTNLMQSGVLLALDYTASHKERMLENFYLKGKRSVAKARNEGPAAWVIPGDTNRPLEAAAIVNYFRFRGVETHRLNSETTVGNRTFPAGSYVFRMDQPYSRTVDMLLDRQYFNVNDPRPYDDTGWTLGALRNVETARVTNAAILDAPMTLIEGDVVIRGAIAGTGNVYLIDHNAELPFYQLRFRLPEVRFEAAREPFEAGGRRFNAGTFVIPAQGNPADLRQQLEAQVTELGLTAHAVAAMPEVPTHPVSVPRIALVHTWTNTQDEGWYRMEFDALEIPYSYVSVHTLRDTPDLKAQYDVILFPPTRGNAQSIVNGISRVGQPIPWRVTEWTPNIANSPAQTDNMRGGIELRGLANLARFLEEGGVFVTIADTTAIPVEYGMADGVSIDSARELQSAGSVFNADFVDRSSPIAYGYGENLAVYFNLRRAPLFRAGGMPSGTGGGGGTPSRPSGRGGIGDPDVVQGMPRIGNPMPGHDGADALEPWEAEAQAQAGRPRVVLRFATNERQVLVSGMLAGGRELVGRPAVIDVPYGEGHMVLFANNPMWRHQTHGSFGLLFNTALHWDNLTARGR